MLKRIGRRHFSADCKYHSMYIANFPCDAPAPAKNKIKTIQILSSKTAANQCCNINIEKYKRNCIIQHHQSHAPDHNLHERIPNEDQSNPLTRHSTVFKKKESSHAKIESSLATQKSNMNLVFSIEKSNSKEFPTFLSQNTLKILNCDFNKIVQIKDFENLENLEILRLSQNCINSLPESIKGLPNLKELYLNKNYILKIPSDISFLQELRILILSYNKISELPICIGKLSKLRILEIQGNLIRRLPTSLSNLIFLERFGLEWFFYVNRERIIVLEGKHTNILRDFMFICIKNQKHPFFDFLEYFQQSMNISDPSKIISFKYDGRERTLLHMASINNHFALLQLLLPLFHNINTLDSDGLTPLLLAIQNKNVEITEELLSIPNIDVNYSNPICGNALILALHNDMPYIALKILEKTNINPNCKDANGNTALHLVFRKFDQNDELYKRISDIIVSLPKINLNERNKSDHTPFLLAAKKDQLCAIKYATNYNRMRHIEKRMLFDINFKGGKEKMNALHYAALFSNAAMLKILTDEGLNTFEVDKFNRRPIHVCYEFHIKKICLKLEKLYLKKRLQGMDCTRMDRNKYDYQLKTRRNVEANDDDSFYYEMANGPDMQEGVSNAKSIYMYCNYITPRVEINRSKEQLSHSRDIKNSFNNISDLMTVKSTMKINCTGQRNKANIVRCGKEMHGFPLGTLAPFFKKAEILQKHKAIKEMNETKQNSGPYKEGIWNLVYSKMQNFKYTAVYSLFHNMDDAGLVSVYKKLSNVCLKGDIIYLLCVLNASKGKSEFIQKTKNPELKTEIYHSLKLIPSNYMKYAMLFLMEQNSKRSKIVI